MRSHFIALFAGLHLSATGVIFKRNDSSTNSFWKTRAEKWPKDRRNDRRFCFASSCIVRLIRWNASPAQGESAVSQVRRYIHRRLGNPYGQTIANRRETGFSGARQMMAGRPPCEWQALIIIGYSVPRECQYSVIRKPTRQFDGRQHLAGLFLVRCVHYSRKPASLALRFSARAKLSDAVRRYRATVPHAAHIKLCAIYADRPGL